MEEIHKIKKNHWTKSKVDEAAKKINNEIYKRNRKAPIQIKLDDLSIFINDKIIWSDIRFLMINKAITPGEIKEELHGGLV